MVVWWYMLVHGEKLKDQHFTLPTYVTQMGLLLKKFMNAQSSLCTGHGPRWWYWWVVCILHGPSDIYLWRKIKPQASACLWDIYACIEYISYRAPIFLSFVLSITFLPTNQTTAPPYQHSCCLYDISRIFEDSWVLRFSQTATFKTIIKSVRL